MRLLLLAFALNQVKETGGFSWDFKWMDSPLGLQRLLFILEWLAASGCVYARVWVSMNDNRKRGEVIGRETWNIKRNHHHYLWWKNPYERVAYPLFVVGLFKPIVVVDGKWVWDSWILKQRVEKQDYQKWAFCSRRHGGEDWQWDYIHKARSQTVTSLAYNQSFIANPIYYT